MSRRSPAVARMIVILHHLDWSSSVGTYNNPFTDDVPSGREDLLDDVIHLKTRIPKLPPSDQQLLSLVGFGFTDEQAAEKLGITQQAVNKRLLRIATFLVAA